MEKKRRRATSNRGIEENTMAILESFCAHDSSHVHDDRLAFLEAVRTASIVPESKSPPTNKMMDAIFEIFRESKSLELILASYQLLNELEEHFPRVYLSDEDDDPSSPGHLTELVVIEEAWSPFATFSEGVSSDRRGVKKKSTEPIDAAGFHLLIEGLTEMETETESSDAKLRLLANMLLFQYLVNVLERDFLPRNHAFQENMSWISVRESLLNKLLGSRKINYKGFVKNCLFVVSSPFTGHTQMDCNFGPVESPSKVRSTSDKSLALCIPEVEKSTFNAVQKLLIMMMELDSSRKNADIQSLTTRADGGRTPVVEVILDELSYDKDMISPFLQGFDEPKLKLQIVSQYFQKYAAKPSTRNRRSNGSQEDTRVTGFFNCFVNNASTKAIIKKISAEAIQVLLAHALLAGLSLSREELLEGISDLKGDAENNPLVNICKNVISAFTRFREVDEHLQILPIGKEALFAATTVLSTRS